MLSTTTTTTETITKQPQNIALLAMVIDVIVALLLLTMHSMYAIFNSEYQKCLYDGPINTFCTYLYNNSAPNKSNRKYYPSIVNKLYRKQFHWKDQAKVGSVQTVDCSRLGENTGDDDSHMIFYCPGHDDHSDRPREGDSISGW